MSTNFKGMSNTLIYTLQKWKITGLDKRIFERKIVNITLAYVLGAQKNDLFENVLLSTHDICFG